MRPATVALNGLVSVEADDVFETPTGSGWFVWVGDSKRFYPMHRISGIYFKEEKEEPRTGRELFWDGNAWVPLTATG